MRKSAVILDLERELLEQGCPSDLARRHVREVSEHREDIISEAKAEGASDAGAEAIAESRLGNPEEIAAKCVAVARGKHWWGRNPIISFCLLPPVVVLMAFGAGLFLLWCGVHFSLDPLQKAAVASGGPGFAALAAGVSGAYHLAILLTALASAALIRRSGHSLRWVVWSSLICAIMGYYVYPNLRPHALALAVRSSGGNWTCAALPLMVAAVAAWRQWRATAALVRAQAACLALVIAVAGLGSGCASHPKKPFHERAWLGGQYAAVKRTSGLSFEHAIRVFPPSVPKDVRYGLLATRVETNSPARQAGLQEGDLILKIHGEPVTSLGDFYKRIDGLKPGTNLSLTVFRNGQTVELEAKLGREVFEKWKDLGIGLFVAPPDLWPNPGFSLIFLGYKPTPAIRSSLDTVQGNYYRSCGATNAPQDPGWHVWAGIFSLGRHDTVLSQQP